MSVRTAGLSVIAIAIAACGVATVEDPERGAAGKADVDLGTCTPDDCGGPARDGNGFCDEECARFGDCGADVLEACGLPECSGSGEASIGCDQGSCEDGACTSATWGLNDVSVLFPAGDEDVPHLLGTVNELDGKQVVLLDDAVFRLLGTEAPFLTETPDRDKHYDKLRVTSFRLDPCVDGLDPHAPACERAIRLVLQPAWPVGDGFDVFDASIHTFHALDEERWTALLADYGAIRTTDLSAEPLRVHPVLAAEGVDGSFGSALEELIVRYATHDNLMRMTFMATGRSGNNWFWGGFDRRADGSFAPIELPGGSHEDGFHQHGRDVEMELPPIEDFPTAFLNNPGLDALDEDEVTAGLRRLYEIENPQRSSSTNTRCAACHLSAETKDHVLTRLQLEELESPERYTAEGLDLRWPRGPENTGFNMHAFSWFRGQPSVSQRVVNESAEVVLLLRD
jgi:hypothetical protein